MYELLIILLMVVILILYIKIKMLEEKTSKINMDRIQHDIYNLDTLIKTHSKILSSILNSKFWKEEMER